MSLTTWIEEFAPGGINRAKTTTTDTEDTQWSLQKWKGLRPENLAKHGVDKGSNVINDIDTELEINSTSCPLCTTYVPNGCVGCPLYVARDGLNCYEDQNVEPYEIGPYREWVMNGDPEPMIALLERALVWSQTFFD